MNQVAIRLVRSANLGEAVSVYGNDVTQHRYPSLSIDDVREIKKLARTTSLQQPQQIIVEQIEGSSLAALQALLKLLEEPPAGFSMVMSYTDSSKLPATLLSRVHQTRQPAPDVLLTADAKHIAALLSSPDRNARLSSLVSSDADQARTALDTAAALLQKKLAISSSDAMTAQLVRKLRIIEASRHAMDQQAQARLASLHAWLNY